MENSLKHQAVPEVEINWQFISFSKVIHKLANQALMARVAIPICGAISRLKEVIPQIKGNRLKGADSQIDIAIPCSSQTLESAFCDELNLSTIDSPSNGMQMTLDIVKN